MSRIDSTLRDTAWVMSWFEPILGKTLESNPRKKVTNPQKRSHQLKTLRSKAQKRSCEVKSGGKIGYWINSINESWVDSNQYSRIFWVMSRFESKFQKAFWVMSWVESNFWGWVESNRKNWVAPMSGSYPPKTLVKRTCGWWDTSIWKAWSRSQWLFSVIIRDKGELPRPLVTVRSLINDVLTINGSKNLCICVCHSNERFRKDKLQAAKCKSKQGSVNMKSLSNSMNHVLSQFTQEEWQG